MDKNIAQNHMFENFYVRCQHDSARLRNHEEISQHRVQYKEDKDVIGSRMVCSECTFVMSPQRTRHTRTYNHGATLRKDDTSFHFGICAKPFTHDSRST